MAIGAHLRIPKIVLPCTWIRVGQGGGDCVSEGRSTSQLHENSICFYEETALQGPSQLAGEFSVAVYQVGARPLVSPGPTPQHSHGDLTQRAILILSDMMVFGLVERRQWLTIAVLVSNTCFG